MYRDEGVPRASVFGQSRTTPGLDRPYNHPPPTKARPGFPISSTYDQKRAFSARPRDPKNPPPYPSEIVTFLSYTHKLHLYTPFWEFFNNMWETLNKAP